MKLTDKRKLGDLLVTSGKLSSINLDAVLKKQKLSGKRIGELLIEDKILSEDDILDVLELQLEFPRINFDQVIVDKDAVSLIPQSLAIKYNLIPIGFDKGKISIVISDPLNIFAIDDVKIATGFDVDINLASKEEINNAISKYYSNPFVQKAAEELTKQKVNETLDSDREAAVEEIKNAPAVRMVDSIIKNAISDRASDIHIEPFENYVKIRYRIDGQLVEVLRSPKETHASIISRIKILSNLNIAEKRIPQDGRIFMKVDGAEVDLRVSVLPTVNGEKAVIRILDRKNFLISKDKLGIDEDDLKRMNKIIKSPYGIILVTGPTGSGKSTTLYAILNDFNTVDRNIITVEDPVEYTMDGINQVNVNPRAGLSFASGLRAILRQDPDIIMIGEIRDNETAEIATRAAITGHLVLSTIHTNDSASAVVRLIDMGIEPYLINTAVAGVIAQRLVRKICPNCKEEYEASEYEKGLLGVLNDQELTLYKGKGCPKCGKSGYHGRIGVYEIMEITKAHRELILQGGSTDKLKKLNEKLGMRTLNAACRELVKAGTTTIDEFLRIALIDE